MRTSIQKGPDLFTTAAVAHASTDFKKHHRAQTSFIGLPETLKPAASIPSYPPLKPSTLSDIPEPIKSGLSGEVLKLLQSGFQYVVNDEYVGFDNISSKLKLNESNSTGVVILDAANRRIGTKCRQPVAGRARYEARIKEVTRFLQDVSSRYKSTTRKKEETKCTTRFHHPDENHSLRFGFSSGGGQPVPFPIILI